VSESPDAALYIHIPFCHRHCPYCDFYSVHYRADLAERFVAALLDEAHQRAPKNPQTIYIGGGNPTSLSPKLLKRLLMGLSQICCLQTVAEFTVETNPETLTTQKAHILRSFGVNRISIGVQSFNVETLRALGRHHGRSASFAALAIAKRANFTNISIDLIYGVPGQSVSAWLSDIRTAVDCGVTHISCYALTVEDETKLGYAVRRGFVKLPPDSRVASMYKAAVETLKTAGFKRYEISNFAKTGFECRHNLTYWRSGEYVGLGPSAASFDGTTRLQNPKDLPRYLAAPRLPNEVVGLTPLERAAQCLILALRTENGITETELREKTGLGFDAFAEEIERLKAAGLLKQDEAALRLTERGFLFHDSVAVELIR